MAIKSLPVRSCLIDGEAIVCDKDGLAVFELIRGHRTLASAVHCAFDLLEVDGQDLRQFPIEKRKNALAELLRDSHLSIVLNEHFTERRDRIPRSSSSAARASCQSGLAHPIARDVRRIGSRSKTRRRLR
jgi:ATP-dependent DNA ligase